MADNFSINEIEALMSKVQASATDQTSVFANVSDTAQKISTVVDGVHATMKDHWGNTLSSIGTADKVESFTNYGFSNDTLNWVLWLSLYNDSWVFRRAIDKPAQDEVSCGITIHSDSDMSKVYKLYDKYRTNLINLCQWGALFGGSVGVMLFDGIGKEEMEKPIQKDKIRGKRMRMYVTDRWYGGFAYTDKMVTNMRDMDYGKPKYYSIVFPDGHEYRVHHTYVLRYEHRTAPPLIKNGQLQGWGYAEGSHILNELSRDDQIKASITSLINKCNIEVIKMAGMRGVFMGSDKGNESQLVKRLEMVNWGRTFNSLTFLDKDDEYNHFEFSGVQGLSSLLESNMWLVAASLEMQGILFGDLKGGLSQESDAMARYAVTIRNRCETYLRPVIYKLLSVLYIIEGINESVDFEFNSLTANEDNKIKIDAIESLTTMLTNLQSNGIISTYEVARSVRDYINNNSVSLNISDEWLDKLRLEEQQSILDTITELSKKGRQIPQPDFGVPESFEASPRNEMGESEFNVTEVEENVPTAEQPEVVQA